VLQADRDRGIFLPISPRVTQEDIAEIGYFRSLLGGFADRRGVYKTVEPAFDHFALIPLNPPLLLRPAPLLTGGE
jgi:hypothetical protein